MDAAQLNLLVPLSLTLCMAWTDIQSNRIPNYLTLGTALAGLGFQLGFHGLPGLVDGLLGMGLGFALLICFYWLGGLGAGDVKALAALGTWLGPRHTVELTIYMALSGVVVILFFLWWRGLLLNKIKRLGDFLTSWVLLRPHPGAFAACCGYSRLRERSNSVCRCVSPGDDYLLLPQFFRVTASQPGWVRPSNADPPREPKPTNLFCLPGHRRQQYTVRVRIHLAPLRLFLHDLGNCHSFIQQDQLGRISFQEFPPLGAGVEEIRIFSFHFRGVDSFVAAIVAHETAGVKFPEQVFPPLEF